MALTDLYGINYALANNANGKYPPGEYNGNVKTMFEKYLFAADAAGGEVIVMGKLPAGARVLNATLKSLDLGGSGTLDLGNLDNGVEATDADGFIAAADHSGQASHVNGSGANLMATKFSAETTVTLTFTGATSGATGKYLYMKLEYIVE